ncbi:MAG: RNA-guided pseudouridylation complex pseudouridine synthase subunit Cbf5 [Candidatus Aenigmatarchaeota archaeon]
MLIRSEEETDPNYGKKPEERTIEELIKSSVIIVDKHAGPTSHQVTAWVKEIFGVKKAGHAGTLDPAVTGVLPVALENATKAMTVLMGLEKEYVGIMHLHKEVDESLLRKTILDFIGKIVQVPPVRSAVARRPREREIKFFDVLEIEGRDVLFKVGCEAGTYVRKIVHDLGQKLSVGAHMTELRRTRAGSFTEDQSHSLVEIKDAYEFWKEGDEKPLREILIPVEHAILHVKKVFVKDSAIDSICHGSPIFVSGLSRIQEGIVRGETVAVYSLKNELVALGIAKMDSREMYEKKKGLAIRTDRVFMKTGTYPSRRAE